MMDGCWMDNRWIDGWMIDGRMDNFSGELGEVSRRMEHQSESQGYVWVKKECFGEKIWTSCVILDESHDLFSLLLYEAHA